MPYTPESDGRFLSAASTHRSTRNRVQSLPPSSASTPPLFTLANDPLLTHCQQSKKHINSFLTSIDSQGIENTNAKFSIATQGRAIVEVLTTIINNITHQRPPNTGIAAVQLGENCLSFLKAIRQHTNEKTDRSFAGVNFSLKKIHETVSALEKQQKNTPSEETASSQAPSYERRYTF